MSTWLAMAAFTTIFLLLWLGDPTQIRLGNWNLMTLTFIVAYVFGNGVRTLSGGLVIPMIPDVTDYETYQTGRYAPGVMGTIFSFVDKMISSFGQTVIGITLAFVGFREVFPDVDTPYTEGLFWSGMFLYVGVLMVAWIASLVAMKYYELSKERMQEIQIELQARREEVKSA
jgi:Na+/melibiose symporter-like transporter